MLSIMPEITSHCLSLAILPTIDIGHQLICAKGMHVLCGFNVLLLEYRGYGKSEGFPSEWGFRKDVQVRDIYMYICGLYLHYVCLYVCK